MSADLLVQYGTSTGGEHPWRVAADNRRGKSDHMVALRWRHRAPPAIEGGNSLESDNLDSREWRIYASICQHEKKLQVYKRPTHRTASHRQGVVRICCWSQGNTRVDGDNWNCIISCVI